MAILNDKNSSFALTRVNPKISGNVKITIDSSGGVWLNSIESTKELSSSKFKKFNVSGTASFEADLKQFIGKLPPETVFAIKENNPDPLNTSTSFKDQYDFFYAMGASNLISNQYDEDYAYMAPIWIRDDIPEYFVILKLDDPLDFPYNDEVMSGNIVEGKTYIAKGDNDEYYITYNDEIIPNNSTFVGVSTSATYTVNAGSGKVILLDENKDIPIDRATQFENIMKKAKIIKTFDLTEKSTIGKYIRNTRNSQFFPTSPLTVRFDGGLMTTWNRVS